MLKYRLITACILIPLLIACVFYLTPIAFLCLTAAITLWGAWEWTSLMQMQTISGRGFYLLVILAMISSVLFIPPFTIFLTAFIWWIIASLLVFFYPRVSRGWSHSVFWRGLMGILVLIPCFAAINYIRNQENGLYPLLFLFVLIWGADSIAYFVGKKWGSKKLLPEVSPGKSWQGLMAALLFSMVIALLALWLCQIPQAEWIYAVSLSFITVLFSVMGDLLESMLKRAAGVKDSGRLLPGHGGLLDRIDSLTAAAPIYTLGAILIGMYAP